MARIHNDTPAKNNSLKGSTAEREGRDLYHETLGLQRFKSRSDLAFHHAHPRAQVKNLLFRALQVRGCLGIPHIHFTDIGQVERVHPSTFCAIFDTPRQAGLNSQKL